MANREWQPGRGSCDQDPTNQDCQGPWSLVNLSGQLKMLLRIEGGIFFEKRVGSLNSNSSTTCFVSA